MPGKPLFDIPFLYSNWEDQFRKFQDSGEAEALLNRLRNWAEGGHLKETSSEGSFVKQFFHFTWGYAQEGDSRGDTFNCYPQFPIEGSGQMGGTGQADMALGHFGKSDDFLGIPQVLCEFKDIRSGLDSRQNRKGNTRSPVEQGFDYLRGCERKLTRHELVRPYWVIVTDMNEFRLYCSKFGQEQYQSFVIEGKTTENESLLADTESSNFIRFLFWKLFHRSLLLSDRGPSYLENLLEKQLVHEENLEKEFYLEYKDYREHLYQTILEYNPGFRGTQGQLVRLTQRLLDRCLFVLYCEDMGRSLEFPSDLLQGVLIEHSCSRYYNPDDMIPWEHVKHIFAAMRDGGFFGEHEINRFNGGLFQHLPELENLKIPARVFCGKNQGERGPETLLAHPLTLLYFSAKYNFGIKSEKGERVIDLYALGRIFEQSITELEILEAEAEGKPSINLLSKRKRNGVYYTPEWVTSYIVRETVGTHLEDIKHECGLTPENEPTKSDIAKYRRSKRNKQVKSWLDALDKYQDRLQEIRVVDPTCGSGAFLIQSLEFLKKQYEWIYKQRERFGKHTLWDVDQVTRTILDKNLYGVDINPESVEITKLALWMHTALPGKALSYLDHNIQCGNSLVGPDFALFYKRKYDSLFDLLDEVKRERVNVFDWRAAFPEVFKEGGFDCVVGNPPYVKLQNFRKVEEDVAEYIVNAIKDDGTPLYASTQTGNFDFYLPFIEKGISLLKPEGRMGYIAPNVWMVNEYGKPLRRWLKENKSLNRWIDFKSFQVFDEATTYTALQFFRGNACESVRCFFAPDGDISDLDWNKPHAEIQYGELPEEEAWNLLPDKERRLVEKLDSNCRKLDQLSSITVGIQTSADAIYHLRRLSDNRYETKQGDEVQIEDSLMHPLVSGPNAKRYKKPNTNTYLLFPYEINVDKARLCSPSEMASLFPNGWKYLKRHEMELRSRERNKFDDEGWYRFGRNQNIDKQEMPKLLVPRLTLNLFSFIDIDGLFYLDNVDVGGVLVEDQVNLEYIGGILNAPVCDFIWRRISKPFRGNYRSANKQFIAPLPIPDATEQEKKEVGERAMALQKMHTKRRDLMDSLDRRLQSKQMLDNKRKPNWLWADADSEEDANKHIKELDARLHAGALLTVENSENEIRLSMDGIQLVELFDQPHTPFLAAQWKQIARTTNITEKFTGKRLMNLLLKLRSTSDDNLRNGVAALDSEICELDSQITQSEREMNEIVYALYKLTPNEIELVEQDCRKYI